MISDKDIDEGIDDSSEEEVVSKKPRKTAENPRKTTAQPINMPSAARERVFRQR